MAKIIEKRVAYGGQQGEERFGSRLRMPYPDTVASPVDIVQTQPNYLAGSQSVRGEQHQNGEVASPHGGAILLGRLKDGPYVLCTEGRRDPLESVKRRTGDCRSKISGCQPLCIKIPQKVAKALGGSLTGMASEALQTPRQEGVYIGDRDLG
jgi:hypothetical protein